VLVDTCTVGPGDTKLTLGAGDNECTASDSTFQGDVTVKAKDGDDTVDFGTATVTGALDVEVDGGANMVTLP